MSITDPLWTIARPLASVAGRDLHVVREGHRSARQLGLVHRLEPAHGVGVVTVTIEPDGADASVLTIEHALLPSGLSDQHAHGWTLIAEQLAQAVSRPA